MAKPKLLINSLALLINRLVQGLATFVLTTVIARTLGADQLGKYILAVSYYYIFVTFFGLGLRTLFTRELAKNEEKTPLYLVSGSVLQLMISIIAYALLVGVIWMMPYSPESSRVCYIMGVSVIPFALSNITEAIFQAQERMHLIAVSTGPIYILRLLVMIFVVQNFKEYQIEYVAAIMVLSEILVLVIQWLLLMLTVRVQWKIDRKFIINSFHKAKTFFAIDGAGIIAGKLDILFISLLGSEILVGIYGAIRQLMQPVEIVNSSLCSAAFPRMSKTVLLGKRKQRESVEKLLSISLCILLPLIPNLLFFDGKEILLFVYKNPEFSLGDIPLKIAAASVFFYPLMQIFGYLLKANHLEKYNLFEVIITTVFSGLVGIILIPKYQLLGAACMAVAMYCMSCSLFVYVIDRHLFRIRFGRVLARPLILTGLISSIFIMLQQMHLDLLLNLMIATGCYGLIGALIFIHEVGGIGFVRQAISRGS